MERGLKTVFNRISAASITVATAVLLLLHHHHRHHLPCSNPTATTALPHHRFPRSSCDANHRAHLPHTNHTLKLLSTTTSIRRIADLRDSFFPHLRRLRLLSPTSRVLCVSAGAGHAPAALLADGVPDVTAVDVLDSPPLVRRADPHDLPFFDAAFDLALSEHLQDALFPIRAAAEMERTVRRGGAVVLAVEGWWGGSEVRLVEGLFRRSGFWTAKNVTLSGSPFSVIILRKNGVSS